MVSVLALALGWVGFRFLPVLPAAQAAPAAGALDWTAFWADIVKSVFAGFMVGVGVLAAQWYAKKRTLQNRIRLASAGGQAAGRLVEGKEGWQFDGELAFRVECVESVPDCLAAASVEMNQGGAWIPLGKAELSGKPRKIWGGGIIRYTPTLQAVSIDGYSSRTVKVQYCVGVTDQKILDVLRERKKATLRVVCSFVSVGRRATQGIETTVEVRE